MTLKALKDIIFDNGMNIRSAISILGHFIKAIFGLATVLLISKNFGIELYGQYTFFIIVGCALLNILDLQFSKAYFVYNSSEIQNTKFNTFLLKWYLFQIAFFLGSIYFFSNALLFYFRTEDTTYVMIGFFAIFTQYRLFGFVVQRAEIVKRTLLAQLTGILSSGVILAGVILGGSLEILTPKYLFLLLGFSWSISSIFLFLMTRDIDKKSKLIKFDENSRTLDEHVKYIKFASPLILVTLMGLFGEAGDRWVLQFYTDYTQQGSFGISKQLAGIVLL